MTFVDHIYTSHGEWMPSNQITRAAVALTYVCNSCVNFTGFCTRAIRIGRLLCRNNCIVRAFVKQKFTKKNICSYKIIYLLFKKSRISSTPWKIRRITSIKYFLQFFNHLCNQIFLRHFVLYTDYMRSKRKKKVFLILHSSQWSVQLTVHE